MSIKTKPEKLLMYCPACAGSGEGTHEGQRCSECKGIGEIVVYESDSSDDDSKDTSDE